MQNTFFKMDTYIATLLRNLSYILKDSKVIFLSFILLIPVYSFSQRPTISISGPTPAGAVINSTGNVTYTLTYDGATTIIRNNPDPDNSTTPSIASLITVTGGLASDEFDIAVAGNDDTRTVTVSPTRTTGDGTATISIAGGSATNTPPLGIIPLEDRGAGPSDPFTVSNSTGRPMISISEPSRTFVNRTGTVEYTITYENVTEITLNSNDIIRTSRTPGVGFPASPGGVTISGAPGPGEPFSFTRTVSLTGFTGDGDATISIIAGSAMNANATGLRSAPSITMVTSFTVDNMSPTVAISPPSRDFANSGATVTYTITYTDAATITLAAGNITQNRAPGVTAVVAVSGTGSSTRTVTITNARGNGTIGITIPAGTSTDRAGNMDAGSRRNALAPAPLSSATFEVDNTPPTIMISGPTITHPRITGNPPAANSGAIVTYTITYSGYTGNVTLPIGSIRYSTATTIDMADRPGVALAENGVNTGIYTLTMNNARGNGTIGIRVVAGVSSDLAGNTDGGATSATFEVDNTAPTSQNMVLTMSMCKKGGTDVTIGIAGGSMNNNQVWFAPTGTTTFVANVTTITTASGRTTSILAPTAEGTYKIYVIDRVGNISAPSMKTLTVDDTAPDNQNMVFGTGTPVTKKGGDPVTIVRSDNDDDEVWFAPAGTTTFTTGGPTMTKASGIATSIPAPDDEDTYRIYVIDCAGNISPQSSRTLIVDNTPPNTQNTVFGSNVTQQSPSEVMIMSSGNVNNEVWFAPAGTTSFTTTSSTKTKAVDGTSITIDAPTADGDYRIFVIDAVGNISIQSTAILTVDNTAPTSQNTVFPTSVTQKPGSTVTIASSGTNLNQIWFAPAGTTSFTAGNTITRAAFSILLPPPTSILAPTAEGEYRIYVIDAVGNVSAPSNAILTVDDTPPQITSIERRTPAPATNPTSATSVIYRVTFNEAVTNVDVGDFRLNETNATNATLSATLSTTDDIVYDITANNINLADASFSSMLRLDLIDNNTITDNAGNLFGGSGTQNYTTGQTFTIIHPIPDGPVTEFMVTARSTTTITVTWKNPMADASPQVPNRFLLIRATGAGVTPVNPEPARPEDLPDGMVYIDYDAMTSTYTYEFTGLSSGTPYYFQVIPSTNNGANIRYSTSSEIMATTAVASSSTLTAVGTGSVDFSSIVNRREDAITSFRFTIEDDGARVSEGDDMSMTDIQTIVISPSAANNVTNWMDVFDAELTDGTNTVGGTVTTTNPPDPDPPINAITFDLSRSDLGDIADNMSRTFQLNLWLKSDLGARAVDIDGQVLGFSIADNNAITVSLETSSDFAPSQSATSGDNTIRVVATELRYIDTREPEDIGVGASFPTPPQVEATDANGNRDLQYTGSATIANSGTLDMSNNTGNFTAGNSGVFTFPSSFSFDAAGTAVTVTVNSGTLTDASFSSIDVSYGDLTTITGGASALEISSTSTSTGTGAERMYTFTFTDDVGATTPNNDTSPTLFSGLTIRKGGSNSDFKWNEAISSAKIVSGGNEIPASSITNDQLVFTGIPTGSTDLGYVPDDGLKTYELFIVLKGGSSTDRYGGTLADNIDNFNFHFSLAASDITTVVNNSTFNTDAPINPTDPPIIILSGTIPVIVVATQLTFDPAHTGSQQPPETAYYGTNLLPDRPIATARDVNFTLDKDYAGPVTVANADGLVVSNNTVEINNGQVRLNPNFFYDQDPVNTHGANGTLTFSDGTISKDTRDVIVNYSGESNIIRDTGFNGNVGMGYATDIAYKDFQAADITNTNSIVLEGFTLQDGGSLNDADGATTKVTDITVQIHNWENIRRIELYDGVGTTALTTTGTGINEQAVSEADITFSGLDNLIAPDNGTFDFTIRASFMANVDDNDSISFTITNVVTNATGSQLGIGAPLPASSLSGNENRIEVTATKLIFDNITGASLNVDFTPTIQAWDVNDNLDLDFVEAVTTFNTGGLTTNPANITGSFAAGVFSPTFQFITAGDNIRLTIRTASISPTNPLPDPLPATPIPGVSDEFNILSSFDSNITLSATPTSTFEYVDYTAMDINITPDMITGAIEIDNINAIELAEFSINDGGNLGVGNNDLDGAATAVDEITFTLTNGSNIRSIAIYDGTTEVSELPGSDAIAVPGSSDDSYTIEFTGLNASLSADDDMSKKFSVYVTFDETNVIDRELQQISITNVVQIGGSQFQFSQAGSADGTGAQTPAGTNILNVTATQFVFTESPAPVEGVNVEFRSPAVVQAHNPHSNLDLDYSDSYTLTSATTPSTDGRRADIDQTGLPSNFSNGELNLSALRYTSTGYGSLTISGSLTTATSGGSESTDVINTEFRQTKTGVELAGTVEISGANNIAIFGFGVRAETNDDEIPIFNGFTIRFNRTVAEFYRVPRVFKSIDAEFRIANDEVITGLDISIVGNNLTVEGLSDALMHDTEEFFFIVVDANPAAPQGLEIYPEMSQDGISFATTNPANPYHGSVTPFTLTGNGINISDLSPPEILSLNPEGINIPLDTDLTVIFNEPVVSLDNKVTLYERGGSLIGDILLSAGTVEPSNTFVFDVPDDIILLPDTRYYVLIAPGDGLSEGIQDEENNIFDGITSPTRWEFKTADISPPTFQSSTPEIVSAFTEGFDLKVNMDEPSRVYYMVIKDVTPSGTPPTISELIRRDLDNNPILTDYGGPMIEHDTLIVTQENRDFYASITKLEAMTNYTIYYAAVDIVENRVDRMNPDAVAEILSASTSDVNIAYSNPEIKICSGDYQEITDPIHIGELNSGNFVIGDGQTLYLSLPPGFEFKNDPDDKPTVSFLPERDVSLPPTEAIEIENSSLIKITININSNSNLDRITISNLKVKAAPMASPGNITKIFGSLSYVPNDKVLAQFTITPEIPAEFTLEGGITSISNNVEKIKFMPNSSIEDEDVGTNVFSGTGVVGDSLDVTSAGVGRHDITLVHTTNFGCISQSTQEILIFDNTQVITGLNANYCTDNFNAVGSEANIIGNNNNSDENLNLIELEIDPDQTDDTINIPGIISRSLSSWNIDFDNAGVGRIAFKATFQSRRNGTESIRTQFVTVSDPPTLTLDITGSDALLDGVNYCEDDGNIQIFGTIESFNSEFSYTQSLNFDFDGDGAPDNGTGLTDNGNGTGEIDPLDVVNNNPDFMGKLPGNGYGQEFFILYTVNNSSTTCDNVIKTRIIINRKRTANFVILNKSTLLGCVGEVITFENKSNIVTGSTFEWSFDDTDNATGDNPNDPKDKTPSHIFIESGTYNISLITTSDKNCESGRVTKPIFIGNNPVPDFTYSQIGIDQATKFINATTGVDIDDTDAIDEIDSVYWSFEGLPVAGSDIVKSDFLNTLDHQFPEEGIKSVAVTVVTNNACTRTHSRDIFVVKKVISVPDPSYGAGFDDMSEAQWIPWAKGNDPTLHSWAISQDGGDNISPTSGNFWVTGSDAVYGVETSYLYSPIFDISTLQRPLIALKNYSNLNIVDGVYIEYTTYTLDESTLWENKNWRKLGDLNSGINWYNAEDIFNINAENLVNNPRDEGWSVINSGWRDSRHSLSSIPERLRQRVQFRISFISGTDMSDNSHDGFAVDDIRIGERTRTVLLESFTNTSQSEFVLAENTFLNSVFVSGLSSGVEVVKLNYHTDFPGEDPANLMNPTDHGAKAAYYNITSIPQSVLDGDSTQVLPSLFSTWGTTAYNQRSLQLAEFKMAVEPGINAENLLEIEVNVTPLELRLNNNDVILNVVLLQDSIEIAQTESGETRLYNVVRDLLPNASGTLISSVEAENPFSRTFTWNPDGVYDLTTISPVDVFDLDLLSIVVFIQDEVTKKVYQASTLKSNDPKLKRLTINPVTGIDNEIDELNFSLYPNPANDRATISFSRKIEDDYQLKVYDNFGKLLHEAVISQGTQQASFDTQGYANGFYFIQLESPEKVIAREKLVILKQ